MKFEVYCDESRPELFTSQNPSVSFLCLGSLWIPAELRKEVKSKIKELRNKHNAWGEIKWAKISPSKYQFYRDLFQLFFSYGQQMRFRVISIESSQVNLSLHNQDAELGFYKFYYQMLHHWILDFNDYQIFCDHKINHQLDRLQILKQCLDYANLSSQITSIQALPSQENVLIQLTDLLLGAVSARLNNTLKEKSTKWLLVRELEEGLNISQLIPTGRSEQKMNIFKIQLKGGW